MVTDDVHGWGIELLWRQGASSYGCRLWTLESVVSGGVVSSYQAAVDVSMFVIEEPHGPLAHWDAEGRYWFPDDDDRLPDGVVSQASEQFWVKRFT